MSPLRQIKHKLKRRENGWTKPTILPKKESPEYGPMLATHLGPKLVRKTLANIYHVLLKNGELKKIVEGKRTIFRGNERLASGIAIMRDQFKEDLRNHHDRLVDTPFTTEEIQGLQKEMDRSFRAIHERHKMGHHLLVMDRVISDTQKEQIIFSNGRYPTSSPLELMDLARSIGKQESENPRDAAILRDLSDTFSRAFILSMIMRDFKALEIPATYHQLWNAYDRLTTHEPAPSHTEINDFPTVEKMRKRMYSEILNENRVARKEQMRNETQVGIRKARLRRILSRFIFPRAERKEVYGRFTATMRKRQAFFKQKRATKEGDRLPAREYLRRPFRAAASDAFKRSRYYLRQELQKLGYNPDTIFTQLKINTEGKGDRRFSTRSMRTLNVLSRAFFRKKTKEEKAALVQSILKKYATTKSNGNGASPLPAGIPKPTQERNPRKAAIRAARKERKRLAKLEGERQAIVPLSQPLPEDVKSMLNEVESATRINPEWKSQVYKKLDHEWRKMDPIDIARAMRQLILIKMGTDVKGAGRISDRALRNFTIPTQLHGRFKDVLSGLIHDGILEYQYHVSRKDWVGINSAALHRIIAKYDIRHG